jgi:DNA-binding CsgD family transcriptional regulator
MQVLRTRGFESEQDLPYAGLHALLAPMLEVRERIPPVQARALGTALAVDAPAPHDPFAVPAGVLSMLSTIAEDAPLLAIVDDLQWVDPGSQRAILFAARRLGAEGVALLLGTRDEEGMQATLAGLPLVEVSRLRDDDARALVVEQGGALAEGVADELVRMAGGNPLALRELPSALTEAQRAGLEPPALRLPQGSGVERAFTSRLDEVEPDVRRALTVVAALESGPASVALGALERLGLGLEQLEAGEAAGLLKLDRGEVGYRHPLLRSLAYHTATSGARMAAHRALAEVVTDVSARAWHLSAAALGPDEVAAAALDAAARAARDRGVQSAAAAASARAAELSEDDADRVERLAAAAEDFAEAGRLDDALARAEEAASYPEADPIASRLRILRGRVELRHGGIDAGRTMLVEEAEHCAEGNPAAAAALLLEVGIADLFGGDSPRWLDAAARAEELAIAGGDDELAQFCRLAAALAIVPLGAAKNSEPVLMESLPLLLEGDPLPAASELVTFAGQQLMWMEHLDIAEQVLSRQVDAAREASALGRLVFPLAARAQLHDRRGRWAAAVAEAAEAVQLGRETSQPIALAMALSVLASLEAARGQHAESRAHGEEAVAIMRQFGGPIGIYAEVALGFTALAAEQLDDAVRHLQAADRIKHDLGGREPSMLQYESDLIEALARLGRRDEAERALEKLEGDAELTGRSWAHAVAARARGMMADDDSYAEHFERALAWHASSPQPFPEARTKLAYGERLRRAGERVAAREQLSAAAEAFERVNAAPWAQRAQNELRGTGQTLRRASMPESDSLTPSELQVALRVAEGLTNREVAAAIFISPKTVEHHLSSIYRKLGIRSRTELARRIAASDPAAAPAA